MHVFASYVRVRARIIIKINMLVDIYTDSLSFKFYENPFIGCGEIAETKLAMHIYHFHCSQMLSASSQHSMFSVCVSVCLCFLMIFQQAALNAVTPHICACEAYVTLN